MKTKLTKENVIDFIYINLGILLMALSYSFFLAPNDIVSGGVSGLGIIFNELWGLNPSNVILIGNVVLLIVGLFFLGKSFFIKTIYGSIAFPLYIKLFDWLSVALKYNPEIDIFLVVTFASLLSGLGIGLVLKHGSTTGGTEILQKMAFKFLHMPFSISLYIIDGFIIVLGYLAYKDVELIMYALIYLAVVGFVMDAVIFSGFNKRAVYIISAYYEDIKQKLLDDFERGVTSIKVVGEYTQNEYTMLICVLSSAEYNKLRDIVENLDPNAFYFAVRASEVRGEGFTYVR